MKGNNKAFLSFNNKSFIENIIEALEDIDKIYISVDEKEKYKSLDLPLIEDEYKDIGPIGGMYSAFKKMNCDFILVLPCDMPRVNKEFVKFLLESVKEEDSCVVLQDSENRLYPLGAVYNRNILIKLEDMIKRKDYRLVNLVKNIDGRIIKLKEEDKLNKSLINVNDPEEYDKLNRN